MPNWCSNILTVRGLPEHLAEFMSSIKIEDGEYKILDSLCPVPSMLEEIHRGGASIDGERVSVWRMDGDKNVVIPADELEKIRAECNGHDNAYDWCIEMWGSKWGDCYTELKEISDSGYIFEFDSAWSPPIEGITHIAKEFPNLCFYLYFEEGGMGFMGNSEWTYGEHDYFETVDYLPRDNLYQDLPERINRDE